MASVFKKCFQGKQSRIMSSICRELKKALIEKLPPLLLLEIGFLSLEGWIWVDECREKRNSIIYLPIIQILKDKNIHQWNPPLYLTREYLIFSWTWPEKKWKKKSLKSPCSNQSQSECGLPFHCQYWSGGGSKLSTNLMLSFFTG